jgi:hypothetical protein
MMGLARRATLLVALSLLTSAATATQSVRGCSGSETQSSEMMGRGSRLAGIQPHIPAMRRVG